MKAKCEICGKELEIVNPLHLRIHGVSMEEYKKRFPKAKLISDEFRKKLSGHSPWDKGIKIDYDKYPNFGMKGKSHSDKTKKGMSKVKINYFKTHEPWNKGKTKETDEILKKTSEKMSVAKKKNWEDPEYSRHMSEVHKGKGGHEYTSDHLEERRAKADEHNKCIIEEMRKFEEKGLRVIPIDVRGYPKPDFIVIDGDRVFSVEVELKTPNSQKLAKYQNFSYFDDIIWIVRDGERR